MKVTFCLRDKRFLGMESVTHGEVPLRSVARPAFIELGSPTGRRMVECRVLAANTAGEAMTLELSPWWVSPAGTPMEWMNHEARPRVATSDWSVRPSPEDGTRLFLDLTPASRTFGDWSATGFSYRYRYESRSLAIYKMLDRGTWEPGGRAVGHEVWMRGTVPAIARLADQAQAYSTEWYLPSAGNPNVYQFFPLQTHLQGFTFTVGDHGVLITWATQPTHLRALLQKPAGVDVIEHWYEHCADLGLQFNTVPMEVLFVPGRLDRAAAINLYLAVREHIWSSLHEQAGIRRERVTSFGFIEQWDRADMDRYRTHGLPKLIDAGVKTVGLANHFRNNMNVLGVSNMCCTLDLRVADSVGEDRLSRFCAEAEAAGVRVEMWGNTALSSLGMLLDRNGQAQPEYEEACAGYRAVSKARDPFVRNANGTIDADHYAPSFLVLNLRDPTVMQWWLERWGEAFARIGLRGIFLDSSFNLSSDKFHWNANPTPAPGVGATIDQADVLGHARPVVEPTGAVQSQYLAHLDLVRQMQRIGYRYSAEDCGAFGVSRCGPGLAARLDNLFMWTDAIAQFDAAAIVAAGADPDDVFFRGLAYRLMWMICWDPRTDRLTFRQSGWRSAADEPSPNHLSLIRIFNHVEAEMVHCNVVRDGSAVIYRPTTSDSHAPRIVWAFTDSTLTLDSPATVTDLVTDRCEVTATASLQARRVYRIVPVHPSLTEPARCKTWPAATRTIPSFAPLT
jgi:hypothetical protein